MMIVHEHVTKLLMISVVYWWPLAALRLGLSGRAVLRADARHALLLLLFARWLLPIAVGGWLATLAIYAIYGAPLPWEPGGALWLP